VARRKLIWARMAPAMTSLTIQTNAAGGMNESQDLLQTFRTQAGITRGPVGLTIMRMRLTFHYDGDATLYADLRANPIYFGIKVEDFVDQTFYETNEGSLRGPQLNPHADWMAWGELPPKAVFVNSSGVVAGCTHWSEVDVRSMRKVEELDQTLSLIVQGTTSAGTIGQPFPFTCSASVLLALP